MQVVSKKDQKSELAKQKLLEATKAIIEEYGIRHLTVRNVCEKSGVSSGSLYHHFGTKENLVCTYIEKLFEQVVKRNPIPENMKAKANYGAVLWSFLVYARFCETLGPDTVQVLFSASDHDFFEQSEIWQEIRKNVAAMFLEGGEFYRPDFSLSVMKDIYADLQVLYRGVVISWCMESKSSWLKSERSACENMEHLLFRFLLSFASDEYKKGIRSGGLIVEQPDFASFFDMSDVAIRN